MSVSLRRFGVGVNCRPSRSSCIDGPAYRLITRFMQSTDEIR
jgi:hypothetical protein